MKILRCSGSDRFLVLTPSGHSGIPEAEDPVSCGICNLAETVIRPAVWGCTPTLGVLILAGNSSDAASSWARPASFAWREPALDEMY